MNGAAKEIGKLINAKSKAWQCVIKRSEDKWDEIDMKWAALAPAVKA